jgi:hypothetical protein
MKVLFTADWHIKLGQKSVPVDWAKHRYQQLFKQIHNLEHKAELLVLGGDIFDKLPSMEELELYFDFIMSIRIPTIVYSGNHEAKLKTTTFLTNLKEVTRHLNNLVTVIDDFKTIHGMDFIPYNKLKQFVVDGHPFSSKVLFTHVRGEIAPHVKPEIDLDLLARWDIVLAGDLHSYENLQRNILYPGSPVTTSFHRNTVDTGIILFDSTTLEHEWIKLDLPQLIRKTIKAGDPMPATDYHHTIYEVEGDMAELSGMVGHELLDKKIVKRDTDTTLILDAEMSLEQEVEEYLTYVLQLNEEAISDTLKELSNHIGKLKE